jgi:hypothetical protein
MQVCHYVQYFIGWLLDVGRSTKVHMNNMYPGGLPEKVTGVQLQRFNTSLVNAGYI